MAEGKGFEPSEAFTSPVFKTGTIDQLCQLSAYNGANDRNRTDTPKPELDFKSNASTCSATLALLGKSILSSSLKLDWNYNGFFFICQDIFRKILKFIKTFLF